MLDLKRTFIFCILMVLFNPIFSQWRKIDLDSNQHPTGIVTDAAFVNADTGFVSTSWGILYATVDGGITWIPDTIGGDTMVILRVAFPTPQVGYMTVLRYDSTTAVLKTINGGVHWFGVGQRYHMLQLNGLFFLNADTGFVANDVGGVFKTVDGGQNWSFQFAGSGPNPIFDIRFINDSVGFIFQNGWSQNVSGLSITHDGGKHGLITQTFISLTVAPAMVCCTATL